MGMKSRTKKIIAIIIILFIIVLAKGELPALLIGKSSGEVLPVLIKFIAVTGIMAGLIFGVIVLGITVIKKASRKTLIAGRMAILIFLAGGGVYIANGLHHKPEVFRQILTETVQEDADKLFKGVGALFGTPDLSFYEIGDNLQDRKGNLITLENSTSASTEPCLYQSKVDDMVHDIDEYRVGNIIINEDDPTFGNMDTADVTFVFKWYDFSSVISEFNHCAYNKLLPYSMVGSETTEIFPVIDDLMLSILERVEDAGMTREYEVVYRYYLSEAGSNAITGKGATWHHMGGVLLKDPIRKMILKELDYSSQYKDDPSEESLAERKEIIMNMEIAVELYGKDGAKELLESLGYEGLVSKMISDYTPEQSSEQ